MATDDDRIQPTHQPGEDVDIIRLIHDEFGTATSTIRSQIVLGTVYLDDEPWEGKDKFLIPFTAIDGKTLRVEGPERKWQLTYKRDR